MKNELTCTNYFLILEKRFSREHTKNPNANVWARTDVTFGAVGYLKTSVLIVGLKNNHNFTPKSFTNRG